MGFFEGLTRMIKGEPVFRPGDSDDGWKGADGKPKPKKQKDEYASINGEGVIDEAVNEAGDAVQEKAGPKYLPKINIAEVESNLGSDGHVEYYFEIHGDERVPIELDNIHIFGTKFELDRRMEPAEEREVLVYRGMARKDTAYDKCQIHYRDESGDYFMCEFWLDLRLEDGYYIISRTKLIGAVRDV